MEYKGYAIEEDTSGYAPKESRFMFRLVECEMFTGYGSSVEDCINQIDSIPTTVDADMKLYISEGEAIISSPVGNSEPMVKLEVRQPYWELIDKKADTNNTIDLNAYAMGVEDGAKWQASRICNGGGESIPTPQVEQELLEQIKFLLSCNNEAQALRAIEQYRYWIEQEMYNDNDMVEYADYSWNLSNYNRYISPLSPKKWFEQFKKK